MSPGRRSARLGDLIEAQVSRVADAERAVIDVIDGSGGIDALARAAHDHKAEKGILADFVALKDWRL